MNKAKAVIWLLIFGSLALIISQNPSFFLNKEVFRINLFFWAYESPAIYVAIIFVGLFIDGLIIAWLFSLPTRMRLSKTVRSLNDTVSTQRKELDSLKQEIDSIKAAAPAPPAGPAAPENAPEGPTDSEQPQTS
jgi:uncharacterized integral membrane protein